MNSMLSSVPAKTGQDVFIQEYFIPVGDPGLSIEILMVVAVMFSFITWKFMA